MRDERNERLLRCVLPAISYDMEGAKLRLAGQLLMLGGVVVAGVGFLSRTEKAGDKPPAAVAVPPLDAAYQAIPGLLDRVYAALNAGNPQVVASIVSESLLNDAKKLDAICPPFLYRAHYIKNIIERPDNHFEVRVRVLWKPVDEDAYRLFFRARDGRFVLEDVDLSDAIGKPDLDAATELAKRFTRAARAGDDATLRQLVSSGFDLAPFVNDSCGRGYFQNIENIRTTFVGFVSRRPGLQIDVRLGFDACGASSGKFIIVEWPDGGQRIVSLETSCLGVVKFKCDGEYRRKAADPELETYTLRRFGLKKPAG